MFSSRILCLIFLSLYLIIVTNGKSANKIYGGKTVKIEDYPYQVSVQIRDVHLCGGAIISTDHILTSASCILAERNVVYGNIQVLSGTNDLMREETSSLSEIHEVAYVIFHEKYNPHQSWVNDIAILRLTSRIIMTHVQFLAHVSTLNLRSSDLYLTGWGKDPVFDRMMRYLQHTDVITISSKTCNNKYYKQLMFNQAQHCCSPRSKTTYIIQVII
ncbi:chymotrypsin-2-like [Aphidius gifuensis]|uniref:chymotrypsin-2-like n=1 Tax=Aphidius gifuensis TaxID=684658 RepID=UPI001CDD2B66|nr:chymotrypsin-2-like [Aphidius gifuensis]